MGILAEIVGFCVIGYLIYLGGKSYLVSRKNDTTTTEKKEEQ